jgi:hypothetical protein
MYLPTEKFNALAEVIASMTDMEKNDVVIMFGDRCDIWPSSIKADVSAASRISK